MSSGYKKFTTNIIWVALSRIIISLRGLITLPIIAKMLGSQMYGFWIQVNTTIQLLLPVISLRLETGAIRFLADEENKKSISTILWSMVLLIIITGCFFMIIPFCFSGIIASFIFNNTAASDLVYLTFFLLIIHSVNYFLINYWRIFQKIKKFALINLLQSIIEMIFIYLAVKLGYGVKGAVASVIIVESIAILLIIISILKQIGFFRINMRLLKPVIMYSLPLIPNSAIFWIISSSDKYLIAYFKDLSQVGIYAASYSLASVIILYYTPITLVLFPKLIKLWEKSKKELVQKYFEYSIKLFILVGIPSAVGLYLISQPILKELGTNEFAAGSHIVILIATGTIFLGIFHINAYIFHLVKKTKKVLYIVITGALINLLSNIFLIPILGIYAAAITTCLSSFSISLISVLLSRKFFTYNIDATFTLKIIFSSFVMYLVLSFINISSISSVIFTIIIGMLIYLITIYLIKLFKPDEIGLIKNIFIK